MSTDEQPGIDATSIEKELTVLWKEAEESEGSSPVVRACSLNLIVLEGDDPVATEILDLLSAEHPARTFLISTKQNHASKSIESWVAAKCSIPLPGEKQVCSEQIHLTAGLEGSERIPSVVTSLLVPDVPVVLWHRGTDAIPSELFQTLQELSDFTILDSATDADLDRSISLLGSDDAQGFGDLAWERGQWWRTLLAQVFDPPSERQLLDHLTSVKIHYGGNQQQPRTGISSAMLLAGWLCQALALHNERSFRREAGGTTTGDFTLHGKPVRLELTDERRSTTEGDAIHLLLLEFGKSSIAFSVNDSENCFHYVRRHDDGSEEERSIPRRKLSDAEMISRLLTVLTPDPAFLLSLKALGDLWERR